MGSLYVSGRKTVVETEKKTKLLRWNAACTQFSHFSSNERGREFFGKVFRHATFRFGGFSFLFRILCRHWIRFHFTSHRYDDGFCVWYASGLAPFLGNAFTIFMNMHGFLWQKYFFLLLKDAKVKSV